MISHGNSHSDAEILRAETSLPAEVTADVEAQVCVSGTNRSLEEAALLFWEDGDAAREAALRLLKRFGETSLALETRGWPPERIRTLLAPFRTVFATSSFMRRCQEWPLGYAGDFETIEYLAAGVNHSLPGTLGWHIEEILLQSPVVQQHRNKLNCQSLEIGRAVMRSRTARVLSIACGGCLDWMPILPRLKDFAGDIVLNDRDPAALELAGRRLRSATTQYRLVTGNVIRVAKRLAAGPPFDLIVAGGLFDYLSDRAIVILLRTISQSLFTPGGILLFTNIAAGNPWRPLMEYGSNWILIERSEGHIGELCLEAGIAASSVSITREATGLTLIVKTGAIPSGRSSRPWRSEKCDMWPGGASLEESTEFGGN